MQSWAASLSLSLAQILEYWHVEYSYLHNIVFAMCVCVCVYVRSAAGDLGWHNSTLILFGEVWRRLRSRIQGTISESWEQKGRWQECPLSSLFFILVLEVLNRDKRQDKQIKGLRIKRKDLQRYLLLKTYFWHCKNPRMT